ncbi:hypothetical protein PHISP_00924 [Aspergillus sp. HF37]|nr:hypothetical protein PHISP_00924 [Aspergillus sp. HF37]
MSAAALSTEVRWSRRSDSAKWVSLYGAKALVKAWAREDPAWSPDIVVGVDFGMAYTGSSSVAHFNASIPQFARRKVEFLFSVPATWKDVRMVEETRRLLEDAVNASSPNHRVFIGLTEAEAAAVYAGNEHY